MTDAAARAHRNLVDGSARLFRLDPGAIVDAEGGLLLGAGSSPNPAISNAAFRHDDEVSPDELLSRARSFFGELGRGFSLWVRDGVRADVELAQAAEGAGLSEFHRMPEMLLHERPLEPPLPAGVGVDLVRSRLDADQFWSVAASSYASLGFPQDVFDHYEDHTGLVADNVRAFLARRGEEPVAIAMTIVTEGIAGIYWVGCVESARGQGLGRALTAIATNAGLDLGADVASLQASPMGEPIYRAMGYEPVYDYRLLMAQPAPGPDAQGPRRKGG